MEEKKMWIKMNPLSFTMLNDRDFQTYSVAWHLSPTSDYFVLKFQKEVAFHMKKKKVCLCMFSLLTSSLGSRCSNGWTDLHTFMKGTNINHFYFVVSQVSDRHF